MDKFNSQQVKETLALVIQKLEKHNIEYRLLGSVVAASLLGKQHRKIGDLDLIIDKANSNKLLKDLRKLGFKNKGGLFGFSRRFLSLEELVHDKYLEVGFFVGKFTPEQDFFIGNKNYGVKIDKKALGPEKINLHGVQFKSIAKEAVMRGILMSKSNPKRKKELQLLEKYKITPLKKDYIHVYILRFRVDFIYYLIMWFLNVLGKVRVRIGLAYDPWR